MLQTHPHQLVVVPGGPIQWILAQDLSIPDYQPKHRAADVQAIIDNFDPAALGVIDVSYRAGEFNVIDGQRRRTAAIEVGYKEPLLCHVRYDLDGTREAALWASLNDRKPQHIVDLFRTMVRAKSPRVAVEIDRILAQHGYMVDYGQSPTAIPAVRVLEYLHAWGSLPAVLATIRSAWQGDPNATGSSILLSLGAFDYAYRNFYYSEHFLVSALREESPRKLLQDAIARRRDTRSDEKIGNSVWATLACRLRVLYNEEVGDAKLKLKPFKQPKLPYEDLVIAKRYPGKSLIRRAK